MCVFEKTVVARGHEKCIELGGGQPPSLLKMYISRWVIILEGGTFCASACVTLIFWVQTIGILMWHMNKCNQNARYSFWDSKLTFLWKCTKKQQQRYSTIDHCYYYCTIIYQGKRPLRDRTELTIWLLVHNSKQHADDILPSYC